MVQSKLIVTETFRSEPKEAKQERIQKTVDRYLRAALATGAR